MKSGEKQKLRDTDHLFKVRYTKTRLTIVLHRKIIILKLNRRMFQTIEIEVLTIQCTIYNGDLVLVNFFSHGLGRRKK